jgi:excisionase family DNA binding protein
MDVEERLTKLERKIEELENCTYEDYVTPQELAKRMKCSTNYIYEQVRKGKIKKAKNLGTPIRIPMSQFKATVKKNKKAETIEVIDNNEETEPITIDDIRKAVWK